MRLSRGLSFTLAMILPGIALSAPDRTFSAARKDARTIAEVLKASRALPEELRTGALALVERAERHVAGRPVFFRNKVDHGEKIAFVETKDGRTAKVDSHESGFIELFAHDRDKLTDWGEMYLFGAEDPRRLGALSLRQMIPGARPGESRLQAVEAYRVPAQSEETWIVFRRTDSYDSAKGVHQALGRGDALDAMRQAGLTIHDTGPARAIVSSPGMADALQKLLKEHPEATLARAPAR
jgi:hypothetical protein